MKSSTRPNQRTGRSHALALAVMTALLGTSAVHAEASTATGAAAASPAPKQDTAGKSGDSKQLEAVVVSAKNSTRSAVSLSGSEIQKIMPGASALQAIKTLPGVLYMTADPWGNNEQNASIYVHGFGQQQLGYTMDGIPLGDQQYGNYNGLSPQRAIISEDISNVTLYSGAGDLATASTSNLGGTIATFSSDPDQKMGGRLAQTAGSYGTTRTYARFDTGRFGGDNYAYASILHQDQRAWDFDGHQGGNQIDWKFIHDGEHGKLTFYGDYSDKTEPNEDSVYHGTAAGEGTHRPYTRGFSYPNFQRALGYLNANGSTPTADGNNYQDYYSDAQRTDYLTYLKYDWYITDNITWTNQAYFHHDDGAGVVAGPIQVAGLPTLFNAYFPGQDLKQVFGNSGYAIRTTEYDINRRGFLSNLNWDTGDNQFSAGVWWEHNRVSQARRWYPLDVNNAGASTPYTRPDPSTALITQYINDARSDVIQPYISDQWHITPNFSLQAGAKSSFQYAQGWYPVQPLAGSTTGVTAYPNGSINSHKSFLPQFGGTWDITANDQLFFNVQKNMHQFATANNMSPWSLGSQEAFDLFKHTVKPETAWVTELGLRFNHDVSWGPITGISGQVSGYHVNFANRLLGISSTSVIGSINAGAGIIANVGSVSTNGADMAATLHFGRHFSFYDALSYNDSRYNDDYTTGGKVVNTAGKKIPGSPTWMNKFIASFHAGRFTAQLVGDAVGKIYATYTDDMHIPGYFLLSAQASYALPFSADGLLKDPQVALNITNLADRQAYQVLVGAASGTYSTYPIAPRQFFVTFSTRF
ncbi:TonB-dependent receptor [Frateuria aurantia]|uniref:Outer membrane receptor protein n=1 Tax=Frateuria aurantia (strain ATCC 33424 / DSM 6220 / KCTC 2777 / LMG 1558 / NBRC 3245 / NCIMB 13370) TaxID=767434 RepID=H8L532_FRAAD|nr:TonB-dependent receptor [Frateuria aurantia]AFC85746.1 outer membrane receptor protein [Frateuria aurantia DSM 6220]